jgi:predicted DNA-binding transcriptional regulator AlpA
VNDTIDRADPIAASSPILQPAVPQPRLAPLVYGVNDLCELLQISGATLHRLKAAGKLPASRRLGGLLRWEADEIREWVAAGMPDQKRWEALRGSRRRTR